MKRFPNKLPGYLVWMIVHVGIKDIRSCTTNTLGNWKGTVFLCLSTTIGLDIQFEFNLGVKSTQLLGIMVVVTSCKIVTLVTSLPVHNFLTGKKPMAECRCS